jgi:hypothetical protein
MVRRAHAVAAVLAAATILSFLASSLAAEALGGPAEIARVKRAVAWGLLLLVPAMAATGATGMRLAGGRTGRLLRTKLRRTAVAAANGVLVLVPAALYLDHLAQRGELGRAFVTVQVVELLAGLANLTLVGLNLRDGLRLAGRPGSPRRDGLTAGTSSS